MNGGTGSTGLARYEFQDRLEDRQELLQHQVESWRGLDRVLERPVLLRVVAGELRGPAGLAARRAATVEDQRLTRVLDILEDVEVALATPGRPTTVIVSEWADGRTLPQYLQANGQQGLSLDRTLVIMDALTSALVAAAVGGIHHGRLTADHVLIAPDDSVRVRGLSIDAVLFGQWPPSAPASGASADVEALARLLYLLVTGVSIDDRRTSTTATTTDPSALVFDPPSWVNPGVPKQIDAVVTEILDGSYRSRWSRPDVQGFRAALGLTGPTSRRRTEPGWQRAPLTGRRVLGVLAAVAVVGVIMTVGAVLSTLGAPVLQPRDAEVSTLLNSPVVLPTQTAELSPDQVLTVERVRSYDPYDDDNADGKPDGRKGRENNKSASKAADGDTTTRWTSNTYRTADADGKGGVGLVLELASPSTVQAVDLDFGSVGSAVEVKVGDDIWPDPMLWTDFATAPAGEGQITIRGPRAVKGKYVLLWFPQLPPTPEDPDRFQARLAEVSVRGE
ncbi:MAG: hypothetical protein ACKN9D_03165 [Actinomycetales bacterium]